MVFGQFGGEAIASSHWLLSTKPLATTTQGPDPKAREAPGGGTWIGLSVRSRVTVAEN